MLKEAGGSVKFFFRGGLLFVIRLCGYPFAGEEFFQSVVRVTVYSAENA